MNYVGCKEGFETEIFKIKHKFYMNYVGCKV